MPFPSPTFLDQIRGALGYVASEFEHLYAQIEGYLRKEHKDDGSHAAVTADSVVVANDVTAGGAGTFGGDLTALAGDPSRECALGALPNDDPVVNSSADCVGLKIGSVKGFDGKPWFLLTQRQGLSLDKRELVFVDGNQSDSLQSVTAALYYVPDGGFGRYVFGPTIRTNFHPGGLDLGYPLVGRRGRINHIYTNSLDAVDGVTERGRTVPMGEWQSYTPSWTSSGTQPNLGNGTLTGQYTLIGDTCHFHITLTFGSTTSFGTGTHRLSLPQAAHSSFTNTMHKAFLFDADGNPTRHEGIGILDASNTAVLMAAASADSTTSVRIMTSTMPFTWATGDIYEVCGFYRIA